MAASGDPEHARRAEPGPVPAWIGGALAPIYGAAVRWRNRRFDAGRGVTRFDLPVVSVGNLSVGGTGKTPMVVHILRELISAGERPCIAMRGYQKRGAPRGAKRWAAGHGISDEAELYKELVPGVPIVAQPDRAAGLGRLLRSEKGEGLTCIVLDDGFQHRRIARDLDIVLIDASRSPFRDRILPAGWLREPAASLARADAVVLTHAEMVSEAERQEIERRVHEINGHGLVAVTRHGWAELRIWEASGSGGGSGGESEDQSDDAGEDTAATPGWLAGKRVAAVCAIGNPAGFLAAVQRAVAKDGNGAGGSEGRGALLDQLVLPDHDKYDEDAIRLIDRMLQTSGAEALVTTEKDWAKLGRLPRDRWRVPVVRPRLELAFERGREELRGMVLAVLRKPVERSARGSAGQRDG